MRRFIVSLVFVLLAVVVVATLTVATTTTASAAASFPSSAHMSRATMLLMNARSVAASINIKLAMQKQAVMFPSSSSSFASVAPTATDKSCAQCVAPLLVHSVNTTINEVNAVCANTTNPAIIEVCGMLDNFGSLWLSYVITTLNPGVDAYWTCVGAQQCVAPVAFQPLVPYVQQSDALLYVQIQAAAAYLAPSVYGLSVLQPALPNSTVITASATATVATAPDCETCVFNYAETVLTRYTTVFSNVCAAAQAAGTDEDAIAVCKFCQAQAASGTDYCRSVVYVNIQPPRFGEGYCLAQAQCQWSNITTVGGIAAAMDILASA